MIVRKRIIFQGRVQGVGFRYISSSVARELGLTGWVANLSNGDVEMEVQGGPLEISHLLKRMNEDRFIRIVNTEVATLPVVKEEKGFQVKYSGSY